MRSFVTHPKNPIRSWSPSKESTFAECPAHAAFDITHKPAQDDGPALVHGRKVHDELASVAMGQRAAVTCKESAPYLLNKVFLDELAAIEAPRAAGDLQAELEVAVDCELKLVDWRAKDAWWRLKIDLLYRPNPSKLIITDWKTGKPRAKDKAQLEQYAVAGALLAKVDVIETRLVYLPSNTVDAALYKIGDVKRLAKKWKARGEEITNPKLRILATPTESACRFCPHKASIGGPCKYEFTKHSVAGLRHKWGGGSL